MWHILCTFSLIDVKNKELIEDILGLTLFLILTYALRRKKITLVQNEESLWIGIIQSLIVVKKSFKRGIT